MNEVHDGNKSMNPSNVRLEIFLKNVPKATRRKNVLIASKHVVGRHNISDLSESEMA